MTTKRGTPQPPPANLAERDLTNHIVSVTGEFVRISHERAPTYDWSDNAESRFSRPGLPCRVLYLARTKETAFWERFGEEILDQAPHARALSGTLLAERVWKTFTATPARPFRCINLQAVRTLRQIGADGATFSATYDITQEWAAALMQHPARIDGILYSSRLDTPEPCLALFSRPDLCSVPAPFPVAVSPLRPLDDPALLALLVREKIALLTP